MLLRNVLTGVNALTPQLLRSWRWRTKDSHASMLQRMVVKCRFWMDDFCHSLFSRVIEFDGNGDVMSVQEKTTKNTTLHLDVYVEATAVHC